MKTQLTTSCVAHALNLRAEGLDGMPSIILTNGQLGPKAVSLKLPSELCAYIQPGDPGLVVTLAVVRSGVDEIPDQPTSGLILPPGMN